METSTFFTSWNSTMIYGAYGAIVLAILVLLYHEFRIFQIKDFKSKYDYVNLHEIRYFWYAVVAVILAAVLWANTAGTDKITESGSMTWFYVRLFMSLSFGAIAYFIFFSMVRIYYPATVEKRLNKLRTKPRISKSGNPMRRL